LKCDINFHLPLPKIINSDATRLKQILINIASNAVKFTERGLLSLDITFDTESQLMEFAIQDSGIGMSEHEIERVFKPFEQADTTT
ncbi:ATP-binding protein, partial [Streptomyces galilaeus]|uniref:ATP-binding protein n=2 Tax=Bacteria TaxID=2 RepID=UPI0038F62082